MLRKAPTILRLAPPIVLTLALVLVLLPRVPAVAGEDWPGFRGPRTDGHSDATGLPLTWSETKNVRWKTPIHGKGWSSPVVRGEQVWLTTATEDGRELFALCLDRATGKVVHDVKLFDVPDADQTFKRYNSYASPTPAIEEGRVYVSFGASGVACLDAATVQRLWERRDIKVNHWRGAGSSPAIFGDLLIIPFDGVDAQFVIALDKRTGKTAWTTKRSVDFKDVGADGKVQADGDFRKAFSTPVVVEIAGRPTLLSLASKALYAYDPATGRELWRLDNHTSHSGSATPVFGNGLIYSAMGFDRQEVMAIRPSAKEGEAPTVVWRITRNAPKKPSLLLVDDLLYMVDDAGIASCLEAATGKDVWRQRLKGTFSASPLYADGRIHFFGENGTTTVIAPGRTWKVLAENALDDDAVMASPAVAGKSLFIRTRRHVYCVGE